MSDVSRDKLPLCVQQLGDYDHKGFIETLTLNESNKNNLNVLTKVTNYYRQVIPVHISALESIRTKSILLSQKHEFMKDDVKKLENEMFGIEENSNQLIGKVIKIQEKQRDLIDRIQCLDLSSFENEEKELTFAEEQYFKFLKSLNEKVKLYQNGVAAINSKLDVIKRRNKDIQNKKLFFEESHINTVKSELFTMNERIQKMHKKLAVIESTIDCGELA